MYILLDQKLVSYLLDEDIVKATAIDLESATELVNDYLRTHGLLGLGQPGRDEIAKLVILGELESRYRTELARRKAHLH